MRKKDDLAVVLLTSDQIHESLSHGGSVMPGGQKKQGSPVPEFIRAISTNHIGAYAAQAAYFFVLSLIPIILLLLTMVQYTPLTKADVMTAVLQVFPSSVESMIASIVNQVYAQSGTVIPITVLVALCSSGKAVLSISTGLNTIYGCFETRNYFYLRIRATFYTVLFLAVIILLLVMAVFGNSLSVLILTHIPAIKPVVDRLLELRTTVTLIVMVGFSILIYQFLPNRRELFLREIPGAIFVALGWAVVSWIFSVYLDVFKGFSTMYGSLTTIVLIMLWLYFCMFCLLLGGLLNVFLYEYIFSRHKKLPEYEESFLSNTQELPVTKTERRRRIRGRDKKT